MNDISIIAEESRSMAQIMGVPGKYLRGIESHATHISRLLTRLFLELKRMGIEDSARIVYAGAEAAVVVFARERQSEIGNGKLGIPARDISGERRLTIEDSIVRNLARAILPPGAPNARGVAVAHIVFNTEGEVVGYATERFGDGSEDEKERALRNANIRIPPRGEEKI